MLKERLAWHSIKVFFFSKIYKYLHFAHKYFLKSQNTNVNMVNSIVLLCALCIHLLKTNNQNVFKLGYQQPIGGIAYILYSP